MDNSYWITAGRKHHINKTTIELLCFELLNIFEASKGIVESRIEALEVPTINASFDLTLSDEKIQLLELHKKYSFSRTSQIILQLGILIRTFDDQMKNGKNAERYRNTLKEIDRHNIGFLLGKGKLTIREACNKIIHSAEIEPQYETFNVQFAENELLEDEQISKFGHLSGDIKLKGKMGDNKPWDATLNVQNFIESVLELLTFEPT